MTLRIAVAGSGIGRTHVNVLKSLPEQYEVMAMAGKDERTRMVAEQFGVPRVTGDFSELCRMPDVDVIDICTPTFLHYRQVLEALAAGKHVIVEKPACGSLREMDELKAAEARYGRRIMPVFQNHLGAGAQKMRHLVRQGVTGPAVLATAETAWRRRWEYYKDTWHGTWAGELGGAVVTLGVHAHDVLTSITGPARSVYCRMKTLTNPVETEDTFAAALELESGGLATMAVTTGSPEQITRIRIVFANLTAENSGVPYASGGEPWKLTPDTPEADAALQAALATFTPRDESFKGIFTGFYESLTTQTPFPLTLDDARQSIELLTAFFLSASTNAPVDLPIPPDHPYYGGWVPKK